MKKLVVGILAHVDAGKTTLSEAMLYSSGSRRTLGRVDHGDAFLDTDVQERERGITIFSKQALLGLNGCEVTLLDTPGHVDFSAEMERTLQVLDYAILVIGGSQGVQGHTRTLWKLLERYNVPTFLYVNKMDLDGADRGKLLEQLQNRLSGGCVDFGGDSAQRDETAALCDEAAMEAFLEEGSLSDELLSRLVAERKVFPCWFGSALKLQGVEQFLAGLETYTLRPDFADEFGARVFKISRDSKNTRLSWMKITGGSLRAKALLCGGEGENRWEEKADQLRLYSGEKFAPLEEAMAGQVVAVTGLSHTRSGMGLGCEQDAPLAMLEPVLNYRMILPDNVEPFTILPKLRLLEEEDPMLRLVWNEQAKQIHVQLMGQVQLEVLTRVMKDRFGLEVSFDVGSIIYKETIANAVEGVGHFEPLRHYAEAHLLMEPGPRGSGLQVATACSTDQLDLNWQRLVLTHLLERDHPGVLTGSTITDLKITLVAGRAHLKHTEGGDFRQATYRAVRQGLMQAKSLLLEPFYNFRLELPMDCVGRAMTDLQGMGGTTQDPETEGEMTVLTGYAPVAGLQNYWQEVTAYTRGLGRLSCSFRGYEVCAQPEKVIEAIGYDPERDVENPADSVFCAHGGGFNVKWNEVFDHMHVHSGLRLGEEEPEEEPAAPRPAQRTEYRGSFEQDKELMAIFERTYGKVERKAFEPQRKPARTALSEDYVLKEKKKTGPEYLLVDGYNIIFAWEELKELAQQDLSIARSALEDILANYRAFRSCEVILVFDAYKVKGNPGSVEKRNNVHIVYTKEAQTADNYIERTTYELSKNHQVRVATSDGLEQVIILGHGAMRLSANAFRAEVEAAQLQISQLIEQHNLRNRGNYKIRDVADLS